MAVREKPNSQRDTIDELWYTIIGTNGEGLVEHVKKLRKDVQELKTTVVTKSDCQQIRGDVKKGKRRRQDVFLMLLAAIPTVAMAIIAVLEFAL